MEVVMGSQRNALPFPLQSTDLSMVVKKTPGRKKINKYVSKLIINPLMPGGNKKVTNT